MDFVYSPTISTKIGPLLIENRDLIYKNLKKNEIEKNDLVYVELNYNKKTQKLFTLSSGERKFKVEINYYQGKWVVVDFKRLE